MSGVSVVASVFFVVISLFIIVMWVRFIVDLVAMLSRTWRPRGIVLVIAEFAYTVTDPPVKAVRRVVPPLRTGGAAIDFSWGIVLVAAILLSYIARAFMM